MKNTEKLTDESFDDNMRALNGDPAISRISITRQQYDTVNDKYTNVWSASSSAWEKLGLYDDVSSLVKLPENGIVLDVGCGTGAQLSSLHAKYPDARLIGVDRCSEMLELAQRRLRSGLINVMKYDESDFDVRKGGMVERSFTYERGAVNIANINGVLLVADDIRSSQVIRAILGERKIDCAVFSCQYASPAVVLEHPEGFRINENNSQAKIHQVCHESLSATFDFATKFVISGGQFIYIVRIEPGERFNLPLLNQMRSHWALTTQVLKDVPKESPLNRTEDSIFSKVGIFVFTRNDNQQQFSFNLG